MRSKRVLLNVITNLLLEFIVVIYGFIVPKLIITNFGSSVNGLISSITQFLGYITLIESGFGPVVKATLYKPVANKDKESILNILKATEKFFRTISFIFIIYIIGLSILYPLIINNEFEYIYTISLIIIISISTFAEYYFGMTYRLYLQAEQKKYIVSLIQIVTYIINIFLVILMVKFNMSIHVIKLFTGLIFVLRPVFQNMYVKRKYNINLNNVVSDYKIKNKWDGLAQHIASVIHNNTDVTLLTLFCTLSEVSVYSVYYMVVVGIKKLIQSFTSGIDALFGNMLANSEHNNLNKKFNMYEVCYNTITTIVFTCTMILIVPFVKIYTKSITDVNYIRYLFGYLLVISEYICMIRLPYISLTYSAGHFKETKIGAWIEAISNIIISVALVYKYGIVGVTIGTIFAMTIRTIEFVYHANKYILKRNIMESVKKMILIICETIIIVILSEYILVNKNVSYLNWFINAIIMFSITSIIVFSINFICYKNEFLELRKIIKRVFKSRRKKENET